MYDEAGTQAPPIELVEMTRRVGSQPSLLEGVLDRLDTTLVEEVAQRLSRNRSTGLGRMPRSSSLSR